MFLTPAHKRSSSEEEEVSRVPRIIGRYRKQTHAPVTPPRSIKSGIKALEVLPGEFIFRRLCVKIQTTRREERTVCGGRRRLCLISHPPRPVALGCVQSQKSWGIISSSAAHITMTCWGCAASRRLPHSPPSIHPLSFLSPCRTSVTSFNHFPSSSFATFPPVFVL